MERSSLWHEPDCMSEREYKELTWLMNNEFYCTECKCLTVYKPIEQDYYCKSCDLFVGFEIEKLYEVNDYD